MFSWIWIPGLRPFTASVQMKWRDKEQRRTVMVENFELTHGWANPFEYWFTATSTITHHCRQSFRLVLKKWKSSSDIQQDLSRDLRFLGKAAATSRSFLELFCACQEGEEGGSQQKPESPPQHHVPAAFYGQQQQQQQQQWTERSTKQSLNICTNLI